MTRPGQFASSSSLTQPPLVTTPLDMGLPVPAARGTLRVTDVRLQRAPHLDVARLAAELQARVPGLCWRADPAVTMSLPWTVLLQTTTSLDVTPTQLTVGFMVASPWSCSLEELLLAGLADFDPTAPETPLPWRRTPGPPLVTRTRRGRDLDVIEWRLSPGPGVVEGVAVEAGAVRLRCLLAGARAETWTATVTPGTRLLGDVLVQAVAGFER